MSEYPRGHAPFAVANHTVNKGLLALLQAPVVHHVVSHGFVAVTLTGRRSGRRITLPVNYRQRGDTVTINVMMPGNKVWWRNLQGDGAPVELRLRNEVRSGFATVERTSPKRAVVTVKLS
jgi:hypothetical protein